MSLAEQLLQARYREQPVTVPSTAISPFIEQLLSHRSVRHYLPDPISDEMLATIIAAAQSAPSSSNLHPWSVIAVRDPARRARLAEYAGKQQHVADAPLQLVWLADLSRLRALAAAAGRPADGLDYQEMFLVGVIDATLAAQNASLAAESLGLGTVFIGGMRNQPEQVADLLDLPDGTVALFGLCVGHPDPTRPAAIKPRPAQPFVLHHESYQHTAAAGTVEDYNHSMAEFYQEQGMKVHGNWALHSVKRIAGPASLSGRDRLVEALHERGFMLK